MAVTGKGASPLRSSWLVRPMQTRVVMTYADDDTAEAAMWADWFFAAPPAPPAGGSPTRTLTGMGT